METKTARSNLYGMKRAGYVFGLNAMNLSVFVRRGETLAKLGYRAANPVDNGLVFRSGKNLDHPASHLAHFGFLHSPCGEGGTSDPDSRRIQRWTLVERYAVAVYGDACGIEGAFRLATGKATRVDIDKYQVVVRSAGH